MKKKQIYKPISLHNMSLYVDEQAYKIIEGYCKRYNICRYYHILQKQKDIHAWYANQEIAIEEIIKCLAERK